MTVQTLIKKLTTLGLRLSVHAGKVRIEGPVSKVDPDLRRVLSLRRGEVLAVLSGMDVPCEGYSEMIWGRSGGVRLAKPPEFRTLCLAEAAKREFPELTLGSIRIDAGKAAWLAWADKADRSQLAGVLMELCDCSRAPAANNTVGEPHYGQKGTDHGVQRSPAAA